MSKSALPAGHTTGMTFTAYVSAASLAIGFYADTFTSADVRAFLESNGIRPRHCNSWGAAFMACQSRGEIFRIDDVNSTRPSRRAGRVVEWRLTSAAYMAAREIALEGGLAV